MLFSNSIPELNPLLIKDLADIILIEVCENGQLLYGSDHGWQSCLNCAVSNDSHPVEIDKINLLSGYLQQ